jgi:hypothetical protein
MNLFLSFYRLKFSILNKCVKGKMLSWTNTHPISIESRIFRRDKRTGKEEVLRFGQDSISHPVPKFAKTSMLYEFRIF